MVQRVTIYGWIVDDHRISGKAYALVDLTYFVDDYVTLTDIFDIIERRAGVHILPKWVDNVRSQGQVEAPKVDVEPWDSHITVGTQRIEEARQQSIEYTSRYNLPQGGMRS